MWGGGLKICGLEKKNVKFKRTENIIFHFSPLLGEKNKKICGRGDNMNKIKSSENIFPFLAGKTRRGNHKTFAAREKN